MLNFNYSIPTKIFFGEGQLRVLGKQIKKYGNQVLLVYGGGSIKKNGIYDEIVEILNREEIGFIELGGVEPNPRITTVAKGIELCKIHDVDLVLAIGGGSAIDCAKVIAAGTHYEGNPWDIVARPQNIVKVLPVGSVLTLAATGSEMDNIAVITNWKTNEKVPTRHPDMAPKFSILDPTYTYSVPKHQTAAGTADILSHVMEVYFSNTKGAFLQNRLAEAVMKTCIEYGKKAYDEPENYEARANLMWASSLAINGLLAYGKETEWSVHALEHELSAFYDITHGVGLAILTPNWLRYALNQDTLYKFVEFGVNVWGIEKTLSEMEIAEKAIEKVEEFFGSLEIPKTLRDVGIDDKNFEIMAERALSRKKIGYFKPLEKEDIVNIFKASL